MVLSLAARRARKCSDCKFFGPYGTCQHPEAQWTYAKTERMGGGISSCKPRARNFQPKESSDGNRQANQEVCSDSNKGANSTEQGAKTSSNASSSSNPSSHQGTGLMISSNTMAGCGFCHSTRGGKACSGLCTQAMNLGPGTQQAQLYAYAVAQQYIPDPPIQSLDPQLLDLTAYRVWSIKDSWLTSVSMPDIWFPNQIISGNVEEGAGIHAYKELGAAIHHLFLQAQRSQPAAIGTVRLWGSVVEHESGYRAEFARLIKVLDVSIGDPWSDQRKLALAFFQNKYNYIEKESNNDV